jgi:hypothetical protein
MALDGVDMGVRSDVKRFASYRRKLKEVPTSKTLTPQRAGRGRENRPVIDHRLMIEAGYRS